MKSLLVLLALAPLSHAAYTYVNADTSNTTLNGVTVILGDVTNGANVDDETARSGTDGYWSYRSNSGYEGGDYWEQDGTSSNGIDPEATDDLVTTITLSTPGTYDIVVVFTAFTSSRDVAAKIGSSPSSTIGDGDIYTASNSLRADQSLAPKEIEFDPGTYDDSRSAHGAGYLGQVTTTTSNESISIYINGYSSDPAGTNQNQRTQYDGVGYQLVPEPSTSLLGLLGTALFVFGRRRR